MADSALASLTVEDVPIDTLRPDPANPRRIEEAELEALTRSMRRFGVVQPVVATTEGTVIAGHQRLVAARRLGSASIPVIRLDLPVGQARLLGLALNRISGSWDPELLARLLAELGGGVDIDLSLSGFGEDEIATYLRSLEAKERQERPEDFDLDEALDRATRGPRTAMGDVWTLGQHRLLCGDATEPASYSRLLAGASATMLFTDPPWNVAIGSDANPRHRQRRGLVNDDLTPEAFTAFLASFAAAVKPHLGGDAYVVLGASGWPTLDAVLRDAGFHWSSTIIWVKDSFVLGRSHFQRRYEPIWYGWADGATSSFGGRRDLDDVWELARPKRSPHHPTTKPVELVERALEASSTAGDRVLDPFGGSGSTLIAADRTGRLASLIELDPLFCDVILARWEAFTSGTARRLEDGAANGVVA